VGKPSKTYCPICGNLVVYLGHRCPEKTLRGIDSSHKAALTRDDTEWSGAQPGMHPSYGTRLSDGFGMAQEENFFHLE
jgi:hypothetical protein